LCLEACGHFLHGSGVPLLERHERDLGWLRHRTMPLCLLAYAVRIGWTGVDVSSYLEYADRLSLLTEWWVVKHPYARTLGSYPVQMATIPVFRIVLKE